MSIGVRHHRSDTQLLFGIYQWGFSGDGLVHLIVEGWLGNFYGVSGLRGVRVFELYTEARFLGVG